MKIRIGFLKRMSGVYLLLAVLVGVPIARGQGAAQVPKVATAGQPPAVASTGVTNGPADTILPKGAIAQVRFANLEKLANDLDDLVTSFVPEEALPPQFQEYLTQKKPLLAFLGQMSVGGPLTGASVAQVTGVDIARPISITLYGGMGGIGYVTAVPVSAYPLLTAMIMNCAMPQAIEPVKLKGGASAYRIVPGNPSLPKKLFLVCSEDTAYFCTTEALAVQVATSPAAGRMGAQDFLNDFAKDSKGSDLTAALDTALVKQFMPMVQATYGTIPPAYIRKLRESIPPDTRLKLDVRARLQFGFDSLDQFLDFAESFIVASYESLAGEVFGQVADSRGLGVALDLAGDFQTITFSFHSKRINSDSAAKPIPMADLTNAIVRLPGARSFLSANGQAPHAGPSTLVQKWAERVRKNMQAKGLKSEKTELFLATTCNEIPEQAVESLAPWTLTTMEAGPAMELPKQGDGLSGLLKTVSGMRYQKPIYATLMPVKPDAFKQYYVEENNAAKSNLLASVSMNAQLSGRRPWTIARPIMMSAALTNDITRLSVGTSYLFSPGLFGYDENEWVNRSYVLYRSLDNTCLGIERGGPNPRWLNSENFGKNDPPQVSITRLLAHTPAGANSLQVLTLDEKAPNQCIDFLDAVESAAHAELDAYLKKMEDLDAAQPGGLTSSAKLVAEMPFYVSSVNRDPVTKKLYLVFPGGLTYPRPQVVPALAVCLKDFCNKSASVGGVASFGRTLPGRHEETLVISTEGVSLLVKSAVNSFFRTYMKTPEGHEALAKLLHGPHDGAAAKGDVLLSNPNFKQAVPASHETQSEEATTDEELPTHN